MRTVDDISTEEIIEEFQQELALRMAVYPDLIEQGKLEPATAKRRLLFLEAAIEHLEHLAFLKS